MAAGRVEGCKEIWRWLAVFIRSSVSKAYLFAYSLKISKNRYLRIGKYYVIVGKNITFMQFERRKSMSKQEFLETLRRALARELSESEVADNINYYWNYIEQQIAMGKSEEQVLQELGDPRLIARTILQVDEKRDEESFAESTVYEGEDGTYREESGYEDVYQGVHEQVHRMSVKDWIRIILVLAIILLVLGTVFHILWKLLPVFLLIAGILWIYRRVIR